MTKATKSGGALNNLFSCYIDIPSLKQTITMYSLPDISDSKSANYPDETALGRSMPFKTYQSSEVRTISWTCHFLATNASGGASNSETNPVSTNDIKVWLQTLQACLYPLDGDGTVPYYPPPICNLYCGSLLSTEIEIPCILKNYNVKFDTNVPWDQDSYIPYKVDIDLQFEVVYNQSSLPGASTIMKSGY